MGKGRPCTCSPLTRNRANMGEIRIKDHTIEVPFHCPCGAKWNKVENRFTHRLIEWRRVA